MNKTKNLQIYSHAIESFAEDIVSRVAKQKSHTQSTRHLYTSRNDCTSLNVCSSWIFDWYWSDHAFTAVWLSNLKQINKNIYPIYKQLSSRNEQSRSRNHNACEESAHTALERDTRKILNEFLSQARSFHFINQNIV